MKRRDFTAGMALGLLAPAIARAKPTVKLLETPEFAEQVKGTITRGKLADLVMLDRDIYKKDPSEIDNARVVLTVMDGRVVYERK